MGKVFILLILITLSIPSYSQEIELGTIFTIQLNNKGKDMNMDFEIKLKNPYNDLIDSNINIDSLFKNKPKENQIFGVFANGKFGSKISPMLILLSGSNDYLDYDLKIKTPKEIVFKKTSTISLFKNVKTIEHWSYQIERIKFKKFRAIPKQDIEEFNFQEKIDSTCIENPNLNIEFAEKEFKKHIELIISEFKESENFKLQKMLEYEEYSNSTDVSLTHFWSLGESIYPNNKNFKFKKTLSFRKIECPYFKATSNYFFEEKNKTIRIIYFKWNTFSESNIGINPLITKNLKKEFEEKFDFLLQTINDHLGIPIQNITEENGRRIVEWKNKHGVSAYMFNFSNYNEINLSIYKE